MAAERTELDLEQDHLNTLYRRLDDLTEENTSRLSDIRRRDVGGNHQHRSERDAFASLYEDHLIRLRNAQDHLCFGRLDVRGAEKPVYIGRIGLSDPDRNQILMDWRAPASEPFYQATAASPGDVVRRRHLATRGRTVTGIEDDVLNLAALSDSDRSRLAGEGALIASLESRRTGRMGDIVATIQAEQDRIIRLPLQGTVVVQGGPGTGKTAVALHRAAYLLFKHREKIAKSGVLLVGPSRVFLRYIEQVLPSLGETGAVLLSPGQLYPGIDTDLHDSPRVARIKGDVRMAKLIKRAIANRQRLPEHDQEITIDGRTIVLRVADVRDAREKARRTGLPHNEARVTFAKTLLRRLAEDLAAQIEDLRQEDVPSLLNDVRATRDARVAINLAWMPLSPKTFLENLYAKPHWLAEAAPSLDEAALSSLHRPKGSPWTLEDIPLLDEIAELIGTEPVAKAPAADSSELEYARAVMDMTGTGGMVSADELAHRYGDRDPSLTVAERAADDREWTFGHLIVDEAQELSPMMWRLLMRRVPSKSATVVGDLAQTSAGHGARSWAEILGPHVGKDWHLEELTVSYRTPGQIMDLANELLTAHFPHLSVPTSVRPGTWAPELTVTDSEEHTLSAVPGTIREELDLLEGGRLAVITAPELVEEVHAAASSLDGVSVATGAAGIDSTVAVLTPTEVKGLEFDGVVVVEPASISPADASFGVGDLYVALTRPTRRLRVIGARPSALDALSPRTHQPAGR